MPLARGRASSAPWTPCSAREAPHFTFTRHLQWSANSCYVRNVVRPCSAPSALPLRFYYIDDSMLCTISIQSNIALHPRVRKYLVFLSCADELCTIFIRVGVLLGTSVARCHVFCSSALPCFHMHSETYRITLTSIRVYCLLPVKSVVFALFSYMVVHYRRF